MITIIAFFVIALYFLFLIYLIKSLKENRKSIKETEDFIEDLKSMVKERTGVET